MAITKLLNHDNHQVQIHRTKPNSKHYSALRCVDCNKHIQWLSKENTNELKSMGITVINPWITLTELGI